MADRVQVVLVPPDTVLSRLPLDASTLYVCAAAVFCSPVLGSSQSTAAATIQV